MCVLFGPRPTLGVVLFAPTLPRQTANIKHIVVTILVVVVDALCMRIKGLFSLHNRLDSHLLQLFVFLTAVFFLKASADDSTLTVLGYLDSLERILS